MRIDGIRTLSGPNIYSHNPVLVMRLYLEDLVEKESYEIPGFIDRLLSLLPGMREHHCSLGRPGGFTERLREGTCFGHVVEHVALELTEHAGAPSFHGKTREAGEPGCYIVAVEYRAEEGTRFLLETAVELVEALVRGEGFPLEERLEQARSIIARTELGPSTRAIVEAAGRRGIPWIRMNGDSLVQLGYGKYRRFIQAAMSDKTPGIAIEIAADKELTKNILSRSSIPVPRGVIAASAAEAVEAFRDLGLPVVVKPLNGCQGRGVSLNLTSESEVAEAFKIAREFSRDVLVEELFEGRNYRVLVVDGSVVAASERLPANVTGDGSHAIAQLIEIANRDPRRGDGHEKPLTRIKVDSIMRAYLKKRGLSLDDVPPEGEAVCLREGVNLSTGGTAIDVTDLIHPEVARTCERASRIIGLDICGVDLVLKDISEPLSRGGVIEVNAAPGLRMHHFPDGGQARDAGAAIVEMLYPGGSPSRIPLVSVTGTNGKTTVTRMIAHVIGETGRTVGMTTTDGIYIGKERICKGDTTGPHSARSILSDPAVEVAVLETARGGIARRGLGYDWSDISVLTNIQPDHIGQDGIESIDDLVYIKSLVAERVREGGTLILNADDERLARLMDEPRMNRLKRNVVYFSLRENHLSIRKHIASGGVAYFARGGWIMEALGRKEYHIARVANIPATLGGTAEFNVANALAAIAACRAYGISKEQIAIHMKSFAIGGDNPGRINLYRVGGGLVMVDYGHNADAIKSICRTAARWRDRRITGVVAVPGDRDDLIIEQAGRAAAAGFHRVIIKEDSDLRGRARGEVPALLLKAIKDEAPERKASIISDEAEALRTAIMEMSEHEVVVVFYENLERVMKVLEEFDAVSIQAIEAPVMEVSIAQV
jgi:cyanophycin synthetase